MGSTIKYKVFIACSKELQSYRTNFASCINNKNKVLIDKGVFLHLFQWEDSLESLSLAGKQNDYNEFILSTDVFVLLYQHKVGQYTREEFEVAYRTLSNSTKKKPEIFIYKCGEDALGEPDKTLADFLTRLNAVGHYYKSCDDPDDLNKQFDQQLNKLFEEGRLKLNEQGPPANQVNERILFCNRHDQSALFDRNITSADTIQFVLITGHERDIADFFVRRKEIELDGDDEPSIVNLRINLTNVEQNTYDDLEILMREAIKSAWNKHELLKNFRIKQIDELTVEKMLQVLKDLRKQYLLITWRVKSFYWKSERLQEYIAQFYQRYQLLNATLNTNLKIFFIGVVIYTENSEMSWDAFQTRVSSLQFGKVPVRLTKINEQQIKDWLEEFELEVNPDDQSKLIRQVLPGHQHDHDYFMSELEEPLSLILRLVNTENS